MMMMMMMEKKHIVYINGKERNKYIRFRWLRLAVAQFNFKSLLFNSHGYVDISTSATLAVFRTHISQSDV